MTEIRELLDEKIKTELENLDCLETGSDKKSSAVEDVTKLYKLQIEESRAENEQADKEAQRKEAKKDRWINVVTQVSLAIGGWIVYDIWNKRGLKFEETGTVTSQWTRNLISKMTPKK